MKKFTFDFGIEDFQKYKVLIIDFGIQIILAIALLVVGLWTIKKIRKISGKLMKKAKVEISLQSFLSDLLNWGLKALLLIAVLSQLGIATTSFVAILGAAGLAVGLALQGALGNFAGGALILLFKPFKVGDLIEAQGELGVVKEIQIFVTKLVTAQNQLAIIPNGILSNGTLKNHSEEGKLRVDLSIGVAYETDIRQAKTLLVETLKNHPLVLKNPAPEVHVFALGDSAIELAVRPWTAPKNYWKVRFETLEACKVALDEANITIPFPQREIRMK
jgi:small conductance mechanosensitive channel